MKHLILLCTGLGLLPWSVVAQSYSSCEPYEQTGNTAQIFDWRSSTFQVYMQGRPGADEILSPFFLEAELSQVNTFSLALEDSKNFEPEDGWELVLWNAGTPSRPVEQPLLVLYNRYSGVMRLFLYAKINSKEHPMATLILSHLYYRPNDSYSSGVLEAMNTPMNALDRAEPLVELAFPNQYQPFSQDSPKRTWLFAEFLTAYDPCICSHINLFSLSPRYSKPEYQIQLNTTGPEPLPVFEPEMATFRSRFHPAMKLALPGEPITGGMTFKNHETFRQMLERQFAYVPGSNGALLQGLGYQGADDFPYLGTALGVFDQLVGGGKQFSAFREGYQYEVAYLDNLFQTVSGFSTYWKVPGAKDASELFVDGEGQIHYDNPMGLLTLLNTPRVYRAQGTSYLQACDEGMNADPYCTDQVLPYSYKFDASNFLYAVNNLAGVELDPEHIRFSLTLYDCGNENHPQSISTPFMPAECLNDYPLFAESFVYGAGGQDDYGWCRKAKIKVAAKLRRSDGSTEDVLFVSSFEATLEAAPYRYEDTPPNAYPHLAEQRTLSFDAYAQEPNLLAWNTVTITDIPGNIQIRPELPEGFIELPPDQITDTARYTRTLPAVPPCDYTEQATPEQLSQFCQNTYVGPNSGLPPGQQPLADPVPPNTAPAPYKLHLFPQPASQTLYVEFPDGLSEPVQMQLLDAQGQTLLVVNNIGQQHTLDISQVPPGIYFVHLSTGSGHLLPVEKVVIVR